MQLMKKQLARKATNYCNVAARSCWQIIQQHPAPRRKKLIKSRVEQLLTYILGNYLKKLLDNIKTSRCKLILDRKTLLNNSQILASMHLSKAAKSNEKLCIHMNEEISIHKKVACKNQNPHPHVLIETNRCIYYTYAIRGCHWFPWIKGQNLKLKHISSCIGLTPTATPR